MLIDAELTFSAGGLFGQGTFFPVGITALANTVTSGPLGGQNTPNTPPVIAAGRDWGMGLPLYLYALWITAPSSAGGALDIQLVTADNPALVSPILIQSLTNGARATSSIPAGTAFRVPLPRLGTFNAASNPTGWKSLLGINFVVTIAPLSAGIVLAFLSRDCQDALVQAAGFSIQ
jgi:hypothetical protein